MTGMEVGTAEILLMGSIVAGSFVTGLRCSVVELQTVACVLGMQLLFY